MSDLAPPDCEMRTRQDVLRNELQAQHDARVKPGGSTPILARASAMRKAADWLAVSLLRGSSMRCSCDAHGWRQLELGQLTSSG
jgi:hypothetical protein